MGRTVHNADDVIRAIKGTGGIKTQIARKLGVSRWTIDNYIDRWVTVREAYEQEKAGVDDAALSVVLTAIVNDKDLPTAKWWVERKLDEFANKSKVEHSGGIEIELDWGDDNDTG